MIATLSVLLYVYVICLFRRATDLEPLQPLLRKYIGFLEMEVSPATLDASRPRVQLERATVWLGIKTLYVNKSC